MGPDASDDEVRWAKAQAARGLEAERTRIGADLARLQDAVPGLKEATDEVAALRAAGAGADEKALARALARLADLERTATARDPTYRQQRERLETLGRRIEELNRRALDKPDARLAYDRAHPPLALLRLADCTSDGFLEPRTALFLVRRELGAFFDERGEPAFHPSDLTRADFSADCHPTPLLDDETHHG